jgi:AraC family transcriptional regulator
MQIELGYGGRIAKVVRRPPGGRSWREVERARRFLHDHPEEDVSLERLASLVGLSPFYLVRAFREQVGMPPHRYLTHLRIARACELLRATSLSITEICRMVGFTSLSHFGSTFRRHVGMAASDYRKVRYLFD